MSTSDEAIVTSAPEVSGGRSARFSHRPQPAARPATASTARTPIFRAVMPACPNRRATAQQWTNPSATIAARATAGWATAAEASASRRGASKYFAAADAEAAIGPPKPIRNETQPERKAASGPYASERKT